MKKIDFKSKHFGMALARMNLPLLNVKDFLDIPQFESVEIPPEILQSPSPLVSGKLFSGKFTDIHCGGIMEYQISSNIAYCDRGMQDEFIRQAENVLSMIGKHGVRCAALECPLNSILEDPSAMKNLERILKKLAPALHRNGVTLLLPFRIPSHSDADTAEMMEFLRGTLIPAVKVRLDVHPHELPKDFIPGELAGLLRFETRSVLFLYDADSGNRLIPQHIVPWIEYLDAVGMDGPFLSCPQSQDQRMSIPESDSFAKFVNDLRNS